MTEPRDDIDRDARAGTEPGPSPVTQPTAPGGAVAGLGYTGDDAEEAPDLAEDGVDGLGYTGREPVAQDDVEDLDRPI